jgi:hypothetical protein
MDIAYHQTQIGTLYVAIPNQMDIAYHQSHIRTQCRHSQSNNGFCLSPIPD